MFHTLIIPFYLNKYGLLFGLNPYCPNIQVTVAQSVYSQDVSAVFDTGAYMVTLPPKIAEALHFNQTGIFTIGTIAGTRNDPIGKVDIEVGGKWFRNAWAMVDPSFNETLIPLRMFELRGYNVDIDFKSDMLRISR